jgi:hypothetical protein
LFYTFYQARSREKYIVDDSVGHYVIIEAKKSPDANQRAISVGVYFDGIIKKIDCPCCGERWKRADDASRNKQLRGNQSITIDGRPLDRFVSYSTETEIAHVYYENGRHVVYTIKPNGQHIICTPNPPQKEHLNKSGSLE